jgi:hypothetical protein
MPISRAKGVNESDIDMIQIRRLKWAGRVIGLMIKELTWL